MKSDRVKKGFLGRHKARPDQAGFFRRGLAIFVDFMTVMVLSVTIFLAISEITAAKRGEKGEWTKVKEALRSNSSVTIGMGKARVGLRRGDAEKRSGEVYAIEGGTLDLICEFLVGYTYFILCFRFGGRTLGKRLFGLRVVDLKGRLRLGWYQAFERTHGYAASTLSGSVGFLQVLWDREGLTMHDKIAGTTVVRLIRQQALMETKKPQTQDAGAEEKTHQTSRS